MAMWSILKVSFLSENAYILIMNFRNPPSLIHLTIICISAGFTDSSGLFLRYTTTPWVTLLHINLRLVPAVFPEVLILLIRRLPKLAGVLLMGTGGRIMPHSTESMETSCRIEEDKEIHPFRFRTHTHELGKFRIWLALSPI